MTAALTLGNRGYEVTLIEKSDQLGGLLLKLDRLAPSWVDASEVARKQADLVRSNPNIRLLMSTRIDEVNGYIGHFKVLASTNGAKTEFGTGVIIVATGARFSGLPDCTAMTAKKLSRNSNSKGFSSPGGSFRKTSS